MAKLELDTPLYTDELPHPRYIPDDTVLNLQQYRHCDSIPTQPAPEGRLVLTVSEFMDAYVTPDYVIDGLFKRGYLYSFTAMTGAGKTAIWLLISEIASNRKRRRKLGIHQVEHVRVVYIACENATDVRERLMAMKTNMGFKRDDLDLLVIDKVFDLQKNLPRIRKEVEAFGGNVGLVVIDTSAAMFQGEDENSTTQMLEHAKTQRKLCELPATLRRGAQPPDKIRCRVGVPATARRRRIPQRGRRQFYRLGARRQPEHHVMGRQAARSDFRPDRISHGADFFTKPYRLQGAAYADRHGGDYQR
jgi:hypothetical protein